MHNLNRERRMDMFGCNERYSIGHQCKIKETLELQIFVAHENVEESKLNEKGDESSEQVKL